MKIYCLKDYKENFLSHYDSDIYRSGMNKEALREVFQANDIELEFISFSEVQSYNSSFWSGKYVVYTSSEDDGFLYKNYIEDIVYYLELSGAKVIPDFRFLKANNNKVFMELLLQTIAPNTRLALKNMVFGCYEEIIPQLDNLKYPLVFKKAAGAMSKGVGVAANKTELISNLKKISKSSNARLDFKDKLREIKHPGYKKDSTHRNKFILQTFIPNLNGDYKVLIFADKYYVLKRGVKPGDFRASGSGIKTFEEQIPDGLLHFAKDLFHQFNLPNISLDIAFDGKDFYLIEFQAIHFGTFTLVRSDHYWLGNDEGFELIRGKSNLEEEYAISITKFLKA